MSVPGRIGIILIIALALVDAFILASGAKQAATAIETHALVEQTATFRPAAAAQRTDGRIDASKTLLSAAMREISLIMAKPVDRPTGT